MSGRHSVIALPHLISQPVHLENKICICTVQTICNATNAQQTSVQTYAGSFSQCLVYQRRHSESDVEACDLPGVRQRCRRENALQQFQSDVQRLDVGFAGSDISVAAGAHLAPGVGKDD